MAELAGQGCTIREIADLIGVAFSSFEEAAARQPLRQVIYHARSERRRKLREMQWDAARDGNPALLIWLGKQELEQREVSRHELAGVDGQPVELKHDGTVFGADQLAEILSGLDGLGALARTNGAAPPSEAPLPTKH